MENWLSTLTQLLFFEMNAHNMHHSILLINIPLPPTTYTSPKSSYRAGLLDQTCHFHYKQAMDGMDQILGALCYIPISLPSYAPYSVILPSYFIFSVWFKYICFNHEFFLKHTSSYPMLIIIACVSSSHLKSKHIHTARCVVGVGIKPTQLPIMPYKKYSYMCFSFKYEHRIVSGGW